MNAGLDELTMERLRVEGDQPAPLFEEPRYCQVPTCGKPLARKPGERHRRWLVRDYCDRACYMQLRVAGQKPHAAATDVPVRKVCAECGEPFVRRDGERLNRWLERVCCGKRCSAQRARAAHRPTPVPKPKPKRKAKPKTVAKTPVAPCPTPIPDAPPREPGPVWRPAGFSKVPNQWAGHRPPQTDEVVAS